MTYSPKVPHTLAYESLFGKSKKNVNIIFNLLINLVTRLNDIQLESSMKKLILLPMIATVFSGCTIIDETTSTLEYNRYVIERSTEAINENARAIEETNVVIEQNRRELESVNVLLEKVSKS
jgi:methyl-accepting chemotaxis protein